MEWKKMMVKVIINVEEKWMNFFLLLFLCTPNDKTIQKILYKIKFSFLCTPIDIYMKKYFFKIKFSFLCTPIDIV